MAIYAEKPVPEKVDVPRYKPPMIRLRYYWWLKMRSAFWDLRSVHTEREFSMLIVRARQEVIQRQGVVPAVKEQRDSQLADQLNVIVDDCGFYQDAD